ncbi:hypothetical protein AOLI_G00164840 [Acnodon oligacanthus]
MTGSLVTKLNITQDSMVLASVFSLCAVTLFTAATDHKIQRHATGVQSPPGGEGVGHTAPSAVGGGAGLHSELTLLAHVVTCCRASAGTSTNSRSFVSSPHRPSLGTASTSQTSFTGVMDSLKKMMHGL